MKVEVTFKKILVTILIIILGYLLCSAVYVLFDRVMNGFIVDWFEKNYILQEWRPINDSGGGYYYRSIRWWKVKKLILQLFIIFVTLGILSARLASLLYASRQKKKTLCTVGRMINDFMHQDKEASAIFPNEFAEISVQMAEIKAAMQLNEQMLKEEANRKNDLITYLAHDLKTPLTSVIGYLSLLDEVPEMPEEQKEKYVHIALDKALRLEKLINEFFEITRYNLQQIMLDKEMVDLPFMLTQLTDEFYPILSAHGNTIKLELQTGWTEPEKVVRPEDAEFSLEDAAGPERGSGIQDATGPEGDSGIQDAAGSEGGRGIQDAASPGADYGRQGVACCADSLNIYADVEKLARVFNNILKNAIAYSYPNTEIKVGCRVMEGCVQIAFSNQGKTIPRHKLDSIFEKFFRLDDARATNTGGAGLGLAIAREIVTLHGGVITAESEDGITVFTVELPLE